MKKAFKWLLIILGVATLLLAGYLAYERYTVQQTIELTDAFLGEFKTSWYMSPETKDAMTDKVSFSTTGVSEFWGTLDVGCYDKKLAVVIGIKGFYSTQDNMKIMYRVDQNPPVNSTATPALSGQAFWPDDAKTMIDALLSGEKVTVRAFGSNGRSFDGHFDLPEGKQYILQVRKYCGQAQ